MEDIVFLYDQVIENIARLHAFCSMRKDGLEGKLDVEEDVDEVLDLLAKKDLLTMAASTRNFAEAARETERARSHKIKTAEIFISAGPPFFRDTKTTITVYQCLSRVLHAYDLRIFRTATAYFSIISKSQNDFLLRIEAYRREGGDTSQIEEPLVGIMTDREKLTMIRLQYLLSGTCAFLNEVSDNLAKKHLFLQREYR